MQLSAHVQGIGFWTNGIPSWPAACAFVRDGSLFDTAPSRPSPQLLAPNERRRAPESVAVALEVALAACEAAGSDPAHLASVFVSTHGDLAITDYMGVTLASGDPAALSPIRFHNSVHNAAAGYWTIGTGCMAATTAVSAFDASFAEGLLEAMTQLACGQSSVLLVAYDIPANGPAAMLWNSRGVLGAALVLSNIGDGPRLQVELGDGQAQTGTGPLARHAAGNAMSQMLPLLDALAAAEPATVDLHAGPARVLRVQLAP